MSDDQKQHLEFVQATISRLAGNSFLIRGWSITLVSALFALAARDTNGAFAAISFFPCVMFWALDAYFLSQERKFRSLYDSIRKDETKDFSMNTTPVQRPGDAWTDCLVSITVAPFHGAILIVIVLVMTLLAR